MILLSACVLYWCLNLLPETPSAPASADATLKKDEWLTLLQRTQSENQPQRLAELARKSVLAYPNDDKILEVAGDSMMATGALSDAIQCYQNAIANAQSGISPQSEEAAQNTSQNRSSNTASEALYYKLGQAWMADSRPFEALAVLNKAIESYPTSATLRRAIGGLLASLGFEAEATVHLRWLAQRGIATPGELLILGDSTRPQVNESMCQTVLRRHPEDLRPNFGLATLDAHYGKWPAALDRLKPLRQPMADNPVYLALYARALVECGKASEWQSFHESLPIDLSKQPQYWHALGKWFHLANQSDDASQAYLRALELNPFDAEAASVLGSLEAASQENGKLRDRCARRVDDMNQLRATLDRLALKAFNSQSDAVALAEQLSEMGRPWEAVLWLRAAGQMNQDPVAELGKLQQTYHAKIGSATPWYEQVVWKQIKVDTEIDKSWQPRITIAEESPAQLASSRNSYKMVDEATARGLIHTCLIHKPVGEESDLAIYQSGAGGVAAIDYDLDGWTDVYLSNSDGQPMENDSSSNQLFRNMNGQFKSLTEFIGVNDCGFTQGFCVADVNNDGFPDLIVANIGSNRIYRNNGDGTFSNATDILMDCRMRWTTSVACGDLDNDGHLDIFETAYCSGKEPFTVRCTRDGRTRSCSPLTFKGETDRVWHGLPNGNFEDVSTKWLPSQPARSGLALLIGSLDKEAGLDVYVANDMSGNQYWTTTQRDTSFHLSEEGALRGVAFDSRSNAQASMGIASADFDGDGDFDMFVTNHAGEPNTLYDQVAPGYWADRTQMANLHEISLPMLGFGTQYLDLDHDGQQELLVANGHVDDFSHLGDAYRMPMQCFTRLDNGAWSLIEPGKIGPYFSEGKLGRALAKLDINGDGKLDALVTHLFDPVALLVNRSVNAQNGITFRLQGKSCQRDAIGTVISITYGDQQRIGQLFSGDGYQCANERRVDFGVGGYKQIDQISVTWPGGAEQTFGPLESNREYLLVEGETPFVLGEYHVER